MFNNGEQDMNTYENDYLEHEPDSQDLDSIEESQELEALSVTVTENTLLSTDTMTGAMAEWFDRSPGKLIGDLRKRYVDSLEAAEDMEFQRKYGLDAEGNPLAVDRIWSRNADDLTIGSTLTDGLSEMYADNVDGATFDISDFI